MNIPSLVLITPPVNDPVALQDVKDFLRIDGTADDDMLTGFIKSATSIIEKYLNRRLITQTWDFFMDAFPEKRLFDALGNAPVTQGKLSEYISQQKYIEIPIFPLQSVTYLKTFDDSNTEYTMASGDYFVDTASEPGRLALTNDATWPPTYLRPVKGVQIRFVCGYGDDPEDVPFAITQAIKQLVGLFYNNRGCVEQVSALPPSVVGLLSAYRIYRL